MPTAITIRNPIVIQRVLDEMPHGAGRNATEAAENLILEQSENRRFSRASSSNGPLTSSRAPRRDRKKQLT